MRMLYGDPSVAAQRLEQFERDNARKLAGTGCEHCAHGEEAWGQAVCMIGLKHPGCVFGGGFAPKQGVDRG